MFRVVKYTGTGGFKQIIKLPATIEGAIHSIVFNNSTGNPKVVEFKVDDVEFKYDITKSSTELSNVKINIPMATSVSVKAPLGVEVFVSFVELASDPASALNTAQTIVKDITDLATNIKSQLPAGAIVDGDPSPNSTWSSEKISQELSDIADIGGVYVASDKEVGTLRYFAHRRLAGALYGGNTNPKSTVRLNYDGNLHATTFVESSDIRLKSDINIISDAVEKINRLNGYTFNINSGGRKTGVIAQEVLEVIPEAVSGTDEEGYSVAYGNLVGLLIQGIKELSERICFLENENGRT